MKTLEDVKEFLKDEIQRWTKYAKCSEKEYVKSVMDENDSMEYSHSAMTESACGLDKIGLYTSLLNIACRCESLEVFKDYVSTINQLHVENRSFLINQEIVTNPSIKKATDKYKSKHFGSEIYLRKLLHQIEEM